MENIFSIPCIRMFSPISIFLVYGTHARVPRRNLCFWTQSSVKRKYAIKAITFLIWATLICRTRARSPDIPWQPGTWPPHLATSLQNGQKKLHTMMARYWIDINIKLWRSLDNTEIRCEGKHVVRCISIRGGIVLEARQTSKSCMMYWMYLYLCIISLIFVSFNICIIHM